MLPLPGVANPLLLKAFVALDAMHKGKGTRGLFGVLGRQLVVCEQLCAAGYESAQLKSVREAHASMVRVDWDARSTGTWSLSGLDYEAVRRAVLIFEVQLRHAQRADVLDAELSMVNQLIKLNPEARQEAA